jgi:excisionase family DNA binding protein
MKARQRPAEARTIERQTRSTGSRAGGRRERLPVEPLLTAFDVAAILQVRPQTIRRMAALGQLAYHRLNGKELRFTRADVDALLARTRVEPRSA